MRTRKSRGIFTPLREIIDNVLVIFGENAPDTVEGADINIFLNYANRVIDAIRIHPYFPGEPDDIPYFQSLDETRPIKDVIIEKGLLYEMAKSTGDERMQNFMGDFRDTIATIYMTERHGNKPFSMRIVDDGTNQSYSQGLYTDKFSGQVTKPQVEELET